MGSLIGLQIPHVPTPHPVPIKDTLTRGGGSGDAVSLWRENVSNLFHLFQPVEQMSLCDRKVWIEPVRVQ